MIGASARSELAGRWFNQIIDVEHVTYEDLGRPGRVFSQYDYKVAKAALKSVPENSHLERQIRRLQDKANKEGFKDGSGRTMTGRQILRTIWDSYQTDPTARALVKIPRLQALTYTGDDKLAVFFDAWNKLLDDQENPVDDRTKELMFY